MTKNADFSIKHDLARSCFQLWPKIGDQGDKISRKKTGEALAETVFSRAIAILSWKWKSWNLLVRRRRPLWGIFSIKHDLARSCFHLWLKIGDEGDKIFSEFCHPQKKWKFWNLLVRRRRPLCGFGNFEKIIQNYGFFLQTLKIMANFEKFRIIFSKVGGKFWRWEG